MTRAHHRTDPACRQHHPPRGWLTKWWFDHNRGRACSLCVPAREHALKLIVVSQAPPRPAVVPAPEPNAALVVGPNDVLVLSFRELTHDIIDQLRTNLAESHPNLVGRVLFVRADHAAVVQANNDDSEAKRRRLNERPGHPR